jgi:hypothetical protein
VDIRKNGSEKIHSGGDCGTQDGLPRERTDLKIETLPLKIFDQQSTTFPRKAVSGKLNPFIDVLMGYQRTIIHEPKSQALKVEQRYPFRRNNLDPLGVTEGIHLLKRIFIAKSVVIH